jgi:hypothetical protein
MTKKYFSNTERLFAEHLSKIGYPGDSFVYGDNWIPVEGRRMYGPDFLIIDPVKKEKLAVIEVKDCEIGKGRSIYRDLDLWRRAVERPEIPIYLVARSASATDDAPLKLYTFDEDCNPHQVDLDLFPSFGSLSNLGSTLRKDKLEDETKKTVGSFKILTWCLAIVLATVLVADVYCSINDIKLLTTERLSLLGVVVALLLLPYVQKFKGLGVEWEREK